MALGGAGPRASDAHKEGVTRMCGRCRHFCGSSLRLSPPYNRISHWREKRTVWLFIVRAGGGDPPSVCRRLLLPLFIYLSIHLSSGFFFNQTFLFPPLEFLSASGGFSCLNSAEIRTSIPGIKGDLLSLNMEFDCFQPYFFDHFDAEEDFYKSTAPSEDIWKKFELLPTPPMSPHRTLSGTALYLSPGDQLSWLTKVLGQDEDYEGRFLPDTEELLDNLSAHIIRDCMWSSFPGSKQPEKVSGKVCVTPAPVRPSKAQCASPGGLPSAPADCVDPAAVLTFPASNCRKPASSGSESRSDSSDEDDDDDEEIDVVTVESKQKRARPFSVRKPVTVTVRADPCPKRFHMSVHRQQHNYAARSPDSDPEPEEEEEEEDDDDDYKEEPLGKRACPASPSDTTPQSSDVEDTDRRKNHNFLERKRRNDLRSRFLALRDQIPGLEAAKAPKVAILTQATEYLMELHTKERRNLQEKKRLKSRQQQLLRRLSELKRS